MTGPEHYREAENLIDEATLEDEDGSERQRYRLAAAQVHATLALAAATALCMNPLASIDRQQWKQAINANTTTTTLTESNQT